MGRGSHEIKIYFMLKEMKSFLVKDKEIKNALTILSMILRILNNHKPHIHPTHSIEHVSTKGSNLMFIVCMIFMYL